MKTKHTYTVESFYMGKWTKLFTESRDFCLGYLRHVKDSPTPRLEFRLMRSDGKVMEDITPVVECSIGQIAGFPTPEQYERAAERALECARQIRKRAAEHEARRLTAR